MLLPAKEHLKRFVWEKLGIEEKWKTYPAWRDYETPQCSDTLSLVILLGSPSSVSICFVGCDTPVARWLTEIETQGVYVLIPLLNYTSFNLGVIIII